MSVIGSNILAGASGQGGDYTIARSLRFRQSASASLTRTPASAGNRRTFTISTWFKLGKVNGGSLLTAGNLSLTYQDFLAFDTNGRLYFAVYDGGATGYAILTTQVFRDPSAWYHVVMAVDTTQATASNRFKMYVNGVQVTAFNTANYPPQNYQTAYNNNNLQAIGKDAYSDGSFLDGYIAETIMVDGQALTPSSFGETSATTGVWQPKKYAGTYGTNGFYLPFTDNSGATSTTIGKDFSGNSNNWTPNNISVTAGVTYDSMTDVPTLTSATAANYCVMNPLDVLSSNPAAFSNGNLQFTIRTQGQAKSTLAVSSGKWYWEVVNSSGQNFGGLVKSSVDNNTTYGGQMDVRIAYGEIASINDIIRFKVDLDAGTFEYAINGGSFTTTSVFGSIVVGAEYKVCFSRWNAENGTDIVNFGQRPFAYTPPTGYVALNTFNLPTPTIGATASTQANKYMDATLYTGTGSSQTITNAGSFPPALVWLKRRSAAESHGLWDTVRGGSLRLESNTTGAESSTTDRFSGITSTGFTVTSTDPQTNASGSTYVGWQWRGSDSSAVTNTAGSITSTVSANTSAGFSVVTYTGNATSGATVGHGLGVAPRFIIAKSRTQAAVDWATYHISTGNNGGCTLNETAAKVTTAGWWNNTTPSSTVVTLGSGAQTNGNTQSMVLYCFSEVAGYSRAFSYTGTGNSDGAFVHLGFRPAFVIWKRTDTVGSWAIVDNKRDTFNLAGQMLYPSDSNAENTNGYCDLLSNGFKVRGTSLFMNASGGTYIGFAFAENPFKYSLAR